MNRIVAEWVEKAEGDHASAMRELRARKNSNYDSAIVREMIRPLLQREDSSR